MAITEIPGGVFLPAPIQWEDSAEPGFTSYTLNGTNRKIGFILRAPMTGGATEQDTKLERFEFMIGTVTQNPANGLKVSFQDILSDAPINSADFYYTITTGSINADSWTIPPYITDDGTNTGNRREVERGVQFACVIEFANYSSGDSLVIKTVSQDKYAMKGAYSLTCDSIGAWTKVTGSPAMALVYKTPEFVDVYVPLTDAYAVKEVGPVTVIPDDEPDEVGMAFTLPAPMRIGGAYVMVAPTDNFTVNLYDAESNTVLESVAVDKDEYYANSHNIDYVYVRFETDRLLQGNQIYVLSIVPDDVVDVHCLYVHSTAQMASLPGGATWYYRHRVDGGDWTEVTTQRPLFGLHITGVDHDTTGGGSSGGWQGNP